MAREDKKRKEKETKEEVVEEHEKEDEDDVNGEGDNNSEAGEDSTTEDDDQSKVNMLKNLKYDFASYEVGYIYESLLKSDKEIDLNPSYQREFTWGNEKQDLFIDSVANNYIIPPIILIKLNKKKGYSYECMDGQHRLTVLKHFIEGTPINPELPHHIAFSKVEDDKKVNIYYKQNDELDKLKNKRYMTDDEISAFNDKKIIIVKISNYDSKMEDVFCKIKNEMFLRLQKGERVCGTDILRNSDHPLVEQMRNYNLMTYKTYETNDSFKKLNSLMRLKTKKTAAKLSAFVLFIIRALLVIKNKTLDIGQLAESSIRSDIMKNNDRFDCGDENETKWQECLSKFKKFLTRTQRIQEDAELPKFNEYLLLVLLRKYCEDKDSLNDVLSKFDSISEYNNDSYYKTLFTKKTKGKVVRVFVGSKLENTLKSINEKVVVEENEDEEDNENDENAGEKVHNEENE